MKTPPPTVDDLLREGRTVLAAAPGRVSTREAALLLGHVLGLDEARLRARGDLEVEAEAARRYRDLLARRAAGEPVAYLFGRRELWGRDFLVDPRVLVPRPETEHLVEAALGLELPARPWIVDVGTGSGCLAVTLAAERPAARVVATDLCADALDVARANARRHRVADRVACVHADLAAPVRLERVDLLVSNPPYVDPDDHAAVDDDVRVHEPALALFAAERGRAVLARLLDVAARLRPGVHAVLEIGYDQGGWLRRAVGERPGLELLDLVHDYGGHPRTAVLRRTTSPRDGEDSLRRTDLAPDPTLGHDGSEEPDHA